MLISSKGEVIKGGNAKRLGITPARNGAFVYMRLKRDSKRMIKAFETANACINDSTPREVRVHADVLKVVWLAKHISAGYASELVEIEKLKDALTHFNSALAINTSRTTLEQRLEKIKEANNYAIEREMYVRWLRDIYMHETLSSLYTSLIINDSSRLAAVNAYKLDFDTYQHLKQLLELCTPESGGEFLRALTSLHLTMRGRKKMDRILRLLMKAYARAKAGKWQDASFQLENALVFTGVNNPFYFVEQLKETGDEYTADIQYNLTATHQGLLQPKFAVVYESLRLSIEMLSSVLHKASLLDYNGFFKP